MVAAYVLHEDFYFPSSKIPSMGVIQSRKNRISFLNRGYADMTYWHRLWQKPPAGIVAIEGYIANTQVLKMRQNQQNQLEEILKKFNKSGYYKFSDSGLMTQIPFQIVNLQGGKKALVRSYRIGETSGYFGLEHLRYKLLPQKVWICENFQEAKLLLRAQVNNWVIEEEHPDYVDKEIYYYIYNR